MKQTGKNPVKWTGFFRVYKDGKPVNTSKVLGLKSQMTKGQAKDILREYLRKLENPAEAAEVRVALAQQPFQQSIDKYLVLKEGDWSKLNRANMASLFKCHVSPVLGMVRTGDIKPSTIKEWLNGLASKDLSKTIIQKCLTHVRAIFDVLIEDDELSKNPTRRLSLPKTKRPSDRFLEIAEVHALLNAAEGWEQMVLKIMLVCGLRPSEALGLRLNDVSADRLRIDEGAVPDEGMKETKTEEANAFVPLHHELAAEILAYCKARGVLKGDDFLFPNEDGGMMNHKNFLRRNLARIQQKAGLSGVTHQVLRRTVATHFQKHGPVKAAQHLLRHATPTTTLKHYTKDLEASTVTAVAGWYAEVNADSARELHANSALTSEHLGANGSQVVQNK